MTKTLTEAPGLLGRTFLNFPLALDLEQLQADIAILGIPFGMPYDVASMANDQSTAPDLLRHMPTEEDVRYTKTHYDWDLEGYLLDGRDIRVVDCGNVVGDRSDHSAHYRKAEEAARLIFGQGTLLITLGGDHGVPIPVMRALEAVNKTVTLIHIDAHLDWREDINGETEGYSSPIRRASEMPWIGDIYQIGMRGIGSARHGEVEDAQAHGAHITTAYSLHERGMANVLAQIPDGGPYYLTIDADGLDPTIMPGVMAQTPGGVTWPQIHSLIHGLAKKGNMVGMDLVEIAPSRDVGGITLVHAERLICNFIGAWVRANKFA